MAEKADDVVVEDEVVEEEVEEEKEEPIEEEPPIRKSSAFFAQRRIIEKQGKQIEKLKSEKGGEGDDEENALTPEARKLIQREIEPFKEVLKSQADELEVREYLADHPEDKKLESAIRKRMAVWGGVPVSEIAKTLKFGQANKKIDDEKAEAQGKIKGKSLKGTSARAQEAKLPSTPAEMRAIYERVKKNRETIKLDE